MIIPEDAEDVILELLEDILHGLVGPPKPAKRSRRIRREEPSALSQNIVRGVKKFYLKKLFHIRVNSNNQYF